MLGPLAPHARRIVLTTPASPRAKDPAELARSCSRGSRKEIHVEPDPGRALARALALGGEILVACGSIFLIGGSISDGRSGATAALRGPAAASACDRPPDLHQRVVEREALAELAHLGRGPRRGPSASSGARRISAMKPPTTSISGSCMPRLVSAGVPMRMPEATSGGLGS